MARIPSEQRLADRPPGRWLVPLQGAARRQKPQRNRERLAGFQGAAMSPLVAGTMPAKSCMDATSRKSVNSRMENRPHKSPNSRKNVDGRWTL